MDRRHSQDHQPSPAALGYITAARGFETDNVGRDSQDDDEGKMARSDDRMGAGGACDENQSTDAGQRETRRQRTVDTGTAELGISPALRLPKSRCDYQVTRHRRCPIPS